MDAQPLTTTDLQEIRDYIRENPGDVDGFGARTVARLLATIDATRPAPPVGDVDDLHEAAWGIIAAAWQEAERITDWTEAAERWRDRYHARLARRAIATAEGEKEDA